jgi:hypothetical protein
VQGKLSAWLDLMFERPFLDRKLKIGSGVEDGAKIKL